MAAKLMWLVGLGQLKGLVVPGIVGVARRDVDFIVEEVTPDKAIGQFRLDDQQWPGEVDMIFAAGWVAVQQ